MKIALEMMSSQNYLKEESSMIDYLTLGNISSFTIDKIVPAVNIEEYAPATTPIMIANTKSLIVEPPKKYNANKVNNVVAVVLIERARV